MWKPVIRTKEDDILRLIKSRGFRSVRAFARSMDMNDSNVWRNIRGVQPLDLNVAFRYARTLHVPIEELLRLFRPDEMTSLTKCIAMYNHYTTKEAMAKEEESICQEIV